MNFSDYAMNAMKSDFSNALMQESNIFNINNLNDCENNLDLSNDIMQESNIFNINNINDYNDNLDLSNDIMQESNIFNINNINDYNDNLDLSNAMMQESNIFNINNINNINDSNDNLDLSNAMMQESNIFNINNIYNINDSDDNLDFKNEINILNTKENSIEKILNSNDLKLLNKKRTNMESINYDHCNKREENQIKYNPNARPENILINNDHCNQRVVNQIKHNPIIRSENILIYNDHTNQRDENQIQSENLRIFYKTIINNEKQLTNKIINNIFESNCYEKIYGIELLIDQFFKIYKRISSLLIFKYSSNKQKLGKKNVSISKCMSLKIGILITEDMNRKDCLDKKINTIMKDIIQIILNLLFNYETLEKANNDECTKLFKKISMKNISEGKVDVINMKELHSKSIKDICLKYSSITKKCDGQFNDLNNMLSNELFRKGSFEFLFKIKFETLLNLIFYKFYSNDFIEIKTFLSGYRPTNKEDYLNNLISAFDKRLTYLSSSDVIANKQKIRKKYPFHILN